MKVNNAYEFNVHPVYLKHGVMQIFSVRFKPIEYLPKVKLKANYPKNERQQKAAAGKA